MKDDDRVTTRDVNAEVERILALKPDVAVSVVDAFVEFVVAPLTKKLDSLSPSDVARRNPFVYAALGVTSVEEWTRRAAADIAASSIEGLVGNWLEEVALVVSGGTKPGSGADLQVDREEGGTRVVDVYSIQSTTNTKNAGGRRSDEAALNEHARVLRAQRRHVDLFVGYLFGRQRTTTLRGVTHLRSTEFWDRVSGQEGFLRRLFLAMSALSTLLAGRLNEDWRPLTSDVLKKYGSADGSVDPQKLRL